VIPAIRHARAGINVAETNPKKPTSNLIIKFRPINDAMTHPEKHAIKLFVRAAIARPVSIGGAGIKGGSRFGVRP